jgi:hypothetical protein
VYWEVVMLLSGVVIRSAPRFFLSAFVFLLLSSLPPFFRFNFLLPPRRLLQTVYQVTSSLLATRSLCYRLARLRMSISFCLRPVD